MNLSKEDVLALYEQYKTGASTCGLAAMAGVTRQALASRFQQYGLKMRPKVRNPVTTFKGQRYTRVSGYPYLRNVAPPFDLLHRTMWAAKHGPIPEGTEIRFINGNSMDVRLKNLVACALPPRRKHAGV